jgi:predicted ATP-binding protein involved in virulence
MRIRKIIVKDLFGIFDHEIPMKLEEHITIIHGPNGYGKTIILKLLNALFNYRYRIISNIPFKELSIEFDDSSTFWLKKNIESNKNKEENNKYDLKFEYVEPDSSLKSFVKRTLRPNDPRFYNEINRNIRLARRIGQEEILYHIPPDRNIIRANVDRHDRNVITRTYQRDDEPKWLRDILSSIDIHFIETQRLLLQRALSQQNDQEYEKRSTMIPAVQFYSKELANAIQEKLAEYAALSQSLDRTFPTRLVKESSSTLLNTQQLSKRFEELEEKRSRLMAAGLLDKEKELEFKYLQKIEDSNRNVLSVYVEDVKQKLNVFDGLVSKLDLLVKILNSRFLYKQISIDKKDGFTFKTSDGKKLSPTQLSSGEQHELVLLYELLFKVRPNSLILIDEPELSLHVFWQQQFLKDLQEITKLANFDVLIATHSPQIIHDRWDLTVELKGPKDVPIPDPC